MFKNHVRAYKLLKHESNVVVGHSIAKVGGPVFRTLQNSVECESVPVQVAYVHGAGGVVVAYGPHFFGKQIINQLT